ncbi:MAG: SpoVA/SpoVAEb family sporulation membrane protein [Eubacteriales bacterium]|nr:SpoVA/SpoVAEb family sporulation membrane protein [Eubacteriales bacterium]
MEYFNAFWVGGLICMLVQILMEKTRLMPGRIMVILVVTGAILGAANLFAPMKEYAGAGVTVPLLGFGNILWEGVKKAVDQDGVLGLFRGGFTASAVGISAALIFSYIASWLFQPRMKK